MWQTWTRRGSPVPDVSARADMHVYSQIFVRGGLSDTDQGSAAIFLLSCALGASSFVCQ